MAAHTTQTAHSSRFARLRLLAAVVAPRRLLVFTALAWLFVGALVLGLSVTGAQASTDISYSWETGNNSQFSALECPNPGTQFQVVTSPVHSRDGGPIENIN